MSESKRAVCSHSQGDGKKVTSLTRDHNPDDEEEMQRIENAGGFVTQEIRIIQGGCCKRVGAPVKECCVTRGSVHVLLSM